jgi:4-diphosphocytidyl-2C-methyl-D-erythritol kinase
MCGTNLSDATLMEWSGDLGSDCPIFFSHGAAYCTGALTLTPLPNAMCGTNLSDATLMEWSGDLGSDCPIFFSHGAAYCTGAPAAFCFEHPIEILTECCYWLVLARPNREPAVLPPGRGEIVEEMEPMLCTTKQTLPQAD